MQLCLQSYASHEFQLYAVNQSNAPCVEDSYEAGCWSPDEHNAKLLDAVASLFVQPGSLIDVPLHYDLVAIGMGAGGLVSANQGFEAWLHKSAHREAPRGRLLSQRGMCAVED